MSLKASFDFKKQKQKRLLRSNPKPSLQFKVSEIIYFFSIIFSHSTPIYANKISKEEMFSTKFFNKLILADQYIPFLVSVNK